MLPPGSMSPGKQFYDFNRRGTKFHVTGTATPETTRRGEVRWKTPRPAGVRTVGLRDSLRLLLNHIAPKLVKVTNSPAPYWTSIHRTNKGAARVQRQLDRNGRSQALVTEHAYPIAGTDGPWLLWRYDHRDADASVSRMPSVKEVAKAPSWAVTTRTAKHR